MAKTLDEPFTNADLERMYTVTMEKTLDEPFANANLERGNTTLYPTQASDEIRLLWAFVRKIYFFLTIQLLLAIAVASVVVFVRPVAHFFISTCDLLSLILFDF
jgi:hypothetical protein